jgi:hypothetical protein
MTDEMPDGPRRRILLRNGLLAGLGTALVGIAAPALTGTARAATGTDAARAAVPGEGFQPSWRWCHLCQGLFYGPFQSNSACPSDRDGGEHDGSESADYGLNYGIPNNRPNHIQSGWAWCHECQGLFYEPFQPQSVCPAGGRHNGSESYNYDAYYSKPGTQPGWAWCRRCQGMYYRHFQDNSVCPAGGQHDGSESLPYGINIL